MTAHTRHGMPPSSHLAEKRSNATTPEQQKEFRSTLLAMAKNLTVTNPTGDFIDDELVKDMQRYGRAVYSVEWADSSIRRVRKDLSEEPKAEIVLTGTMREGCRCWKWQPYREPAAEQPETKTQKSMF